MARSVAVVSVIVVGLMFSPMLAAQSALAANDWS
jgi:hypothetical protein